MSLEVQHYTNFIEKCRLAGSERLRYIDECLADIKKEVASPKVQDNENAMKKLIYLYLSGYDISWATLGMVTLIGNIKLMYKRIGYLTASLSIQSNRDLVTLLVNTIRKDMCSYETHICSISMETLSHLLDAHIAANVITDITSHMISMKPGVRRRAVVLMYRCLEKSPELIPAYQDRIISALTDKDTNVQMTACSALCEISQKIDMSNKNILASIITVFTSTTNNWILIKILKMLSLVENINPKSLKEIEQRISSLLTGSAASSLLFECLRFCTKRLSKNAKIINICNEKLKGFLNNNDINLQYMTLIILNDLLESHRNLVMSIKNEIVHLMYSTDYTIRCTTINLVGNLVNKGNIKSIIALFITQLKPNTQKVVAISDDFVDTVILKIIEICTSNNYAYITNFEWYIDTLLNLVLISVENTKNNSGIAIANELMAIALRVNVMRGYLVTQLEKIVNNIKETEILALSAYSFLFEKIVWICCEFNEFLTQPIKLLSDLQRHWVLRMRPESQAVILHSLLKLASFVLNDAFNKEADESYKNIVIGSMAGIITQFRVYITSHSIQLQERSCCYYTLLECSLDAYHSNHLEIFVEFKALFSPELKLVSADAQSKVPIPSDVNLDTWINKSLFKEPETYLESKENVVAKPKKKIIKKIISRPKSSKVNPVSEAAKDYPEQSYVIAPIETGEDFQKAQPVKNQTPIKDSSHNSEKPKKIIKVIAKRKIQAAIPKTEVPSIQNDTKLETKLTIKNFFSAENESKFTFKQQETKQIPEYNIDKVSESLLNKFTASIVEKNENEFLFLITDNNINVYGLVKYRFPESNDVTLNCKSMKDFTNVYPTILETIFSS